VLLDLLTPVAGMPRSLAFLPLLPHTGAVLRDVAVVVLNGVMPFELGVLCEVFGVDRTGDHLPNFDFAVCSPGAAPVATSSGFTLSPQHGLDRLATADLVAVPAMPSDEIPAEVLQGLRDAVDRGARVLSVCSGAFVLGAAGLLDDRRCTTHWMHSEELAATFPRAKVDCDVLYIEDGPIITSAGTAAGIDACLHVVREEFGARAATSLARRMVVPPHRDGGQAQYVETPLAVAPAQSLQPLLEQLLAQLDDEHTVESLAARALLSPRTFARRFKDETGTTPYAWLSARRVELAARLLEETDEPVERIAVLAGFGGAAAMRHHFTQVRGTTPQSYRRAFRTPA
jgi:transcriptional regulator GlxA family with amidase domain